MNSDKSAVLGAIDEAAEATRSRLDKAIDKVKEAAGDAAEETATLARVAGEKIKEAGENLIKATE